MKSLNLDKEKHPKCMIAGCSILNKISMSVHTSQSCCVAVICVAAVSRCKCTCITQAGGDGLRACGWTQGGRRTPPEDFCYCRSIRSGCRVTVKFIIDVIEHIEPSGYRCTKTELPRIVAVIHIVSVEHSRESTPEHCWSLHVRHTSAPAAEENQLNVSANSS